MNDKTALYAMVPPPYGPVAKQWLSRAALVLSSGGVLVALAALLLVVQQAVQLEAAQSRLESTESSIRLLEARLEQLTTLAINGELFEDMEEDEEDVNDLHLLNRLRREVTSEDVQIFNEAYGPNLTAGQTALLHYPALQSSGSGGLLKNLGIAAAAADASANAAAAAVKNSAASMIKGPGLTGNSLDKEGVEDDENKENIKINGLIHYPELQGRGRGSSSAATGATGADAAAAVTDRGLDGNSIADAGGEEYESSEEDEGGYLAPVLTEQDTRNNILPHHRLSSVWPKHTKFPSAKGPEHYSSPYRSGEVNNDVSSYGNNNFHKQRTPTVERRSRVKPTSLLIHRPGLVRPFQHYYHRGNNHHPHRHGSPVMFRTSHVKTTSTRNYINPSLSNTVLPPVTKVAQPKPKARTTTTRPEELNLPLPQAYKSPVKSLKTLRKKAAKGEKKTGKRVTKNQTRRRRTGGMTVAHYVAQASEKTNGINNEGWTQAVWMDKLGLDKKYHLKRGAVIVKEAGLYYIYAQLLYKTGRFGTGYQVMVDGVPIMECSITQASPSDSCHTSGVTYLPSNAEIQVRNKESFMSPVDQTRNSFFGLIKLMDAPSTTEELMGTQ